MFRRRGLACLLAESGILVDVSVVTVRPLEVKALPIVVLCAAPQRCQPTSPHPSAECLAVNLATRMPKQHSGRLMPCRCTYAAQVIPYGKLSVARS